MGHLGRNVAATVMAGHLLEGSDACFELTDERGELVEGPHVDGLADLLELVGRADELALISIGGREDHRLRDLDRRLGLGVDVLAVPLHVDLVATAKLTLRQDSVLLEQGDVRRRGKHGEGVGRGLEIRQPTLLRLVVPILRVAIAVEDHSLVLGDDLLEELLDRLRELHHVAAGGLFELVGDVVEALGDDRVERDERPSDRLSRPDRAELELVAGKGERARAVAVAGVLRQAGQRVDADGEGATRLRAGRLPLLDLLEDVGELLAEEDRDDRRRGLVGPEAVVVAAVGHDRPEEITVEMDGPDHRRAEHEELHVGVGRLTRLEEVAELAADRPVDVLARAVDAGERLLMEEARHAVLLRDTGQRLHDRLLVVGGDVGILVDRGDLVLPRGHFVVPRLHRHAELVELTLHLEHERQHALGDRPEVLILELLPLRRLGTEQRPPGHHQIGTGEVEVAVDEEVFLFRPARRGDLPDILVAEEGQDAAGLLVEGLHRAEERGLLVEGLARPRAEGRGDAEGRAVGIVEDVGRARGIPGGVATGLERRPQPAGGEARGIGLALDQFLAGELKDRLTIAGRREEAVVLLGGQPGERIEDVGVVGGPLLDRPILHRQRHGIGDRRIERLALLDRRLKRLVDALREPVLHHRIAEDVGSEDLVGGRLAEVPGLAIRLVVVDGGDRAGTGRGHEWILLRDGGLRE